MSPAWNSSCGSCSLFYLLISLLLFCLCVSPCFKLLPPVCPALWNLPDFSKVQSCDRTYTGNLHSEMLVRPPGHGSASSIHSFAFYPPTPPRLRSFISLKTILSWNLLTSSFSIYHASCYGTIFQSLGTSKPTAVSRSEVSTA